MTIRNEPMAGNPKFGKRLRELREAKKATSPEFGLRRFAASVGISPTFLSLIEVGKFDPPAVDKVKRMAALLDQNPDELLALAGRIDPKLVEIVLSMPRALAEFLRAVQDMNLDSTNINALTNMIREFRAERSE
jgi:transcriptional regulator with XRE-family HTH domain